MALQVPLKITLNSPLTKFELNFPRHIVFELRRTHTVDKQHVDLVTAWNGFTSAADRQRVKSTHFCVAASVRQI